MKMLDSEMNASWSYSLEGWHETCGREFCGAFCGAMHVSFRIEFTSLMIDAGRELAATNGDQNDQRYVNDLNLD